MTKEMELNQIRTEQNTADPQDHQSCIQHEADTDLENGNLGIFWQIFLISFFLRLFILAGKLGNCYFPNTLYCTPKRAYAAYLQS